MRPLMLVTTQRLIGKMNPALPQTRIEWPVFPLHCFCLTRAHQLHASRARMSPVSDPIRFPNLPSSFHARAHAMVVIGFLPRVSLFFPSLPVRFSQRSHFRFLNLVLRSQHLRCWCSIHVGQHLVLGSSFHWKLRICPRFVQRVHIQGRGKGSSNLLAWFRKRHGRETLRTSSQYSTNNIPRQQSLASSWVG
jgi:hypothetical protein